MSYTSPTITASSGTYAQLKTRGFKGQVEALITANSGLSERQKLLIRSLQTSHDGPIVGMRDVTRGFLGGDPIPIADIKQGILDSTTSLKLMLAACEEIAVLVDANPGTIIVEQLNIGSRSRRVLD